jgi:hypothetical protein
LVEALRADAKPAFRPSYQVRYPARFAAAAERLYLTGGSGLATILPSRAKLPQRTFR